MKIFVDENIPAKTVKELRMLNHDVMDIRGTHNEGMSDEDIWQMVQRDGDFSLQQIKVLPRNGARNIMVS
ncbi:MAG TPA: DUF5615 family PIN-like protein [Candidatus Brocadiaceae bacterium]